MGRVLIVIATQYGQTAHIGEVIKARLDAIGIETDVVHFECNPNVFSNLSPDIETVIIGAPVYIGKFPAPLMNAVKGSSAKLKVLRTAFFSVSLNAADKRPESRIADDRLLDDALKAMDLRPNFVASIAGKIHYTRYGWFKKLMMKRICAAAGGPTDTMRDHEMTDWNQVAAFTDAVASDKGDSDFAVSRRLPEAEPAGTR